MIYQRFFRSSRLLLTLPGSADSPTECGSPVRSDSPRSAHHPLRRRHPMATRIHGIEKSWDEPWEFWSVLRK